MWNKLALHRFRRTSLVLGLCLAFLIGVGGAHTGWLVDASWWWLCLPGILFLLGKRNWWSLLWVLLFGVALGWWRGSLYMVKLADFQHYYERKITITAVAMQDGTYNKYKQMTFDAHKIVVNGTGEHLTGKISLSGFGLNAIFAGDEVTATGKFQPSLGSYQGRMSYTQLQLVSHHNTVVNELRRRFTSGVQSALPEPLASFGMGLLIGQRNTLPVEISQTLLMVGLTHIIAVSGYNLTILLRSANKASGKRSKRLTTVFSLVLIGLFLLFAGTSASIVRAAIVSLLSIAAGYYGRQFKPLVLISLAAAVTAYANPFYVWTDTSWYLSFLAFYGVMVLAPLIHTRWKSRWRESLVLMVALESACAEIMTLPFVLHTFGQMSFIGLVANVMVVALVPLAMLLTLVAGLSGMLLPAFAGWLAWPARIILTYMLDIATMLSHIPHIFVQNLSFARWQMLICYMLLGFITVSLHFKFKAKNAKITERNNEESKLERTLQMVNNQA